MALDAYGPDSAAGRGKADAQSPPDAVNDLKETLRAQLFDKPVKLHALATRAADQRRREEITAKIHAAQEVVTSLEQGDIGPKLAARHLRKHLEEAKRLLGGGQR